MRTGILFLLACGLAFGQAADKTLTFDVASIKPAAPLTPNGRGMIFFRGPSGGPGTKDPGRIDYPNMTLKMLLMTAYDVKNFQISGPPFLDSERFDIVAKMPPETTKEQFHVMLQNLLAERFKMTLHRETKELPMYSLVVGKNGPKLKESPPPAPEAESADRPPAPPPLPNGPPKMGSDGFPILPGFTSSRPGMFDIMMPGRAKMFAQLQTMQDLANRLTQRLNRPVTDNTGLTAKYDFTIIFAPDGNGPGGMPMGGMMVGAPPPPPPPAGAAGGTPNQPDLETPPDLMGALQAQLGLKLEAKKGPVEIIVIDHAEKAPTEN